MKRLVVTGLGLWLLGVLPTLPDSSGAGVVGGVFPTPPTSAFVPDDALPPASLRSSSILGVVGAAHAATAPDQLVRERTGRIIELLKANKDAYTRDPKKLSAMVDKEVLPYFDFRAMSRLVLGKHWREANEDQRNRFTREFRDLLVRTYATALLKYTNEQVLYLAYRNNPGDKTTVVRTEVKQAGGGPNIPIHYSFYLTDGEWKVYDVVIDGVSLVTTYRGSYAEKIRNQGMDALIASMAKSDKDDQLNKARSQKSGGAR